MMYMYLDWYVYYYVLYVYEDKGEVLKPVRLTRYFVLAQKAQLYESKIIIGANPLNEQILLVYLDLRVPHWTPVTSFFKTFLQQGLVQFPLSLFLLHTGLPHNALNFTSYMKTCMNKIHEHI